MDNMNRVVHMDKELEQNQRKAKTWIVRFIKFNIIGVIVFLIGTVIFAVAFPYFGAWTWLVANGAGSVLQFSLISYFNKKKQGQMFNECPKENA